MREYCHCGTLRTLEVSNFPAITLKPVATGASQPPKPKKKPEIIADSIKARKTTITSKVTSVKYLLSRIFHLGTFLTRSSLIVPLEDSPDTISAANIIIKRGKNKKIACSMNLVVNFAADCSSGLILLSTLYWSCSILTLVEVLLFSSI